MKLFSDGLYMISRFEVYPTDGEGYFFWTPTKVNRYYEVTLVNYLVKVEYDKAIQLGC